LRSKCASLPPPAAATAIARAIYACRMGSKCCALAAKRRLQTKRLPQRGTCLQPQSATFWGEPPKAVPLRATMRQTPLYGTRKRVHLAGRMARAHTKALWKTQATGRLQRKSRKPAAGRLRNWSGKPGWSRFASQIVARPCARDCSGNPAGLAKAGRNFACPGNRTRKRVCNNNASGQEALKSLWRIHRLMAEQNCCSPMHLASTRNWSGKPVFWRGSAKKAPKFRIGVKL
jgi:hypothetical protein